MGGIQGFPASALRRAVKTPMRRLLASGLLPQRAGQPVKALVHIYFAELRELDADSALQDQWIAGYQAQWAAHRAAASVATGDGGAWLEGDAARAIACDAMIIPVVTGDIDAGAVEELIVLCARYHQIRTQVPAAGQDSTAGSDPQNGADPRDRADTPDGADSSGKTVIPAGLMGSAARAAAAAAALADLEHQILGKVLQVVSGPGGVASFLRRNLLGKGLNGPSLPLDVGQP